MMSSKHATVISYKGILQTKLIKLKKLTKNEALEIIDNLQKKDFRVSEKLVELIKNIQITIWHGDLIKF